MNERMDKIPPIRHTRGSEAAYRNVAQNIGKIVEKIKNEIGKKYPDAKIMCNVNDKESQITITAHKKGAPNEPIVFDVDSLVNNDLTIVENAISNALPNKKIASIVTSEFHGGNIENRSKITVKILTNIKV